MAKPNVYFILGAPGSGKGTACGKIVDEFKYIHLSAGDLLREERQQAGSQYGELIESHITNGQIVPVRITCSLIEQAMNKYMTDGQFNFLIDGFPRNQDNLDGWEEAMADKVNLKFVLVIDCPEDVCVKRILKRGEHSNRTDDNVESIQKRFKTFVNDSMPIIEHFRGLGLVREVQGANPADEVYVVVRKFFQDAC